MTIERPRHFRDLTGDALVGAEGLRQNLRMIIGLLFDLRLLGGQAYGHLSTANSMPRMQLQVDSIVQTAREATDTIAERLRVLDASQCCSPNASMTIAPAPPPGEPSTEAVLDRIANRILTVVDIIGWVGDRLDTADSSTADVLRAIGDVLQEQAWMLSARELKT